MSSAAPTRVLVADDQADVLEALRFLFRASGYEGDFVTSPAAVLDRLRERSYELLLVDLNYNRDTTSGGEGLELIENIRGLAPTLPVVVMTGWGTIDTAVEAMRRGARSFIQKPWDNAKLLHLLEREIRDGRLLRDRDARLHREDEEARLIQRHLLPSQLPVMAGCDVAAEWRPAMGYGGDCYDVIPLDGPGLGIAIADVAGKGLPAALLMANLQAAVRAFAQPDAAPRTVCERVNRLLCRNMISGRFVTFCYVRLDCHTRTLTFANAGHNAPLLLRKDGSLVRLTSGGTVMGVFDEATYAEGTHPILPGDRLVLYTDGLSEAWSPDGEEFGEDRLIQSARRHSANAPAATLTRAIFDDVLAYTGGVLQDDATLLSVVLAEPSA